MSEKPPKKSGRVNFDDRGNARWDWETETGSFKTDIDTKKLKSLTDTPLTLKDNDSKPSPEFDPYNRTPKADPHETKVKRKSIDDLRKLSEQIKHSKNWKDDKKE